MKGGTFGNEIPEDLTLVVSIMQTFEEEWASFPCLVVITSLSLLKELKQSHCVKR